jgi:hypothetical protein
MFQDGKSVAGPVRDVCRRSPDELWRWRRRRPPTTAARYACRHEPGVRDSILRNQQQDGNCNARRTIRARARQKTHPRPRQSMRGGDLEHFHSQCRQDLYQGTSLFVPQASEKIGL